MLSITFVLFIMACSGRGQGVGPEVMEKIRDMFPYCRIGQDYSDAGVYFVPYAAWKFGELAAHGTPAEKEAFEIFVDDTVREFMADRGLDGEGVTLISDHAGVDMDNLFLPSALEISIRMFGRNKEAGRAVKRLVVVNSGIYAQMFATLWNPLLGDLASQTEVYGSNAEEWVGQLLRTVPSNVLLQGYGGTNPMPQECNRVETKRPFNLSTQQTLRSAMALIARHAFQLLSTGVRSLSRALGDAPSPFASFFH